MADIVYLVAAYWHYIVGVFALGVVVGWWAEGARDADDATAWFERGHDRS